jgi:TolA-binding protein
MVTDTAPEPAPASLAGADPRTHLWQLPTFLLGIAVFVSAWQGWLPWGRPDPAGEFGRDLLALRTAYEKVSADRDELRELLGRVSSAVESFPAQASPARFALGSGYARLAELTADPQEARTYWQLAKHHFEQVRGEELKDPDDPPRLAFRFAKTRAAVGLPATATAPEIRLHITLLANVPFGEEPGEAGRLRAELALRLSPPDTLTARDALTDYLTKTGISTPPASLARAKMILGEIHFRRKEPELARKWLEQIGPEAPAEVAIPARALLARVKMAEEDWLGAARDWEYVRNAADVPPELRAGSAYQLGLCKLNTREVEAAVKLFEEAAQTDGPEAAGAALRLAELKLRSDDRAQHLAAVDYLAQAVKGVTEAKELRGHPYLRLEAVRDVFELAIAVLTGDEAFEAAVRAATSYAVVAAPGRDRERKAEALAGWANHLQKTGGEYRPRATAAAAEYEAFAALQTSSTAQADALRRAAAMHRLAGEPGRAVETLQRATQLPQLPDSALGPVWADLADSLIAANRPEDVVKAFNQAMAAAGPVSTTVRYRLARQFLDARRPELVPTARNLFEQIAKQEIVRPEEQEYHERSLVELAHEHIRTGNYAEAEVWLRKQLSLYPAGPEASLGRLLLGVALLQRASAPPPDAPDAPTALRLRDEAIKHFKQIVADTDARQKRDGRLSERDAWLRLQAGLRVLQTYQQLHKPNDLLAEAAVLLERHRNTVEELIIWSLVYHAFKQKGETGRALQTRDQMKELFDRLPPTAFTATSGEYSRAYWEKVWFAPEPK